MSTNFTLNTGLELSRWADTALWLQQEGPQGKEEKSPHHFWRTFSWRSSTWQCHSGSVSWQCSAQCNPESLANGLYTLEVYKIMRVCIGQNDHGPSPRHKTDQRKGNRLHLKKILKKQAKRTPPTCCTSS